MNQPSPSKAIVYALYANAALLLAILLVLIGHDRSMGVSAAMAQTPQQVLPQQPPIAGGSGLFVMPAQLHPAVWGCYLLDVNRQTLCVYEYQAGTKDLVLSAARYLGYDVQLKDWNTHKSWPEIQKMVEDANNSRGAPAQPPVTPEIENRNP